jgi:hypothetical protein
MKWSVTFLVVVLVTIALWCAFTVGLPSINRIPVSDEPPAFQTAEPMKIDKSVLISNPWVTGEPLYLYSKAEEVRDD